MHALAEMHSGFTHVLPPGCAVSGLNVYATADMVCALLLRQGVICVQSLGYAVAARTWDRYG